MQADDAETNALSEEADRLLLELEAAEQLPPPQAELCASPGLTLRHSSSTYPSAKQQRSATKTPGGRFAVVLVSVAVVSFVLVFGGLSLVSILGREKKQLPPDQLIRTPPEPSLTERKQPSIREESTESSVPSPPPPPITQQAPSIPPPLPSKLPRPTPPSTVDPVTTQTPSVEKEVPIRDQPPLRSEPLW